MFKRTYPIRLRPGVTRETIDELHAVLTAAPQYIPGLLVSDLRPEGSGGPYDLVWENVFESEEAFWLYAAHPYHANVINEYLAPDSPTSVKAISSTGITWDTARPFDSADVVERREQRSGEESDSIDLARADLALERAGIEAPTVHLLEQIELVAGRADAYLDAVRDIYLPLANRHGMRLLMSWRSPPETGESDLTFLWVVDGWGEAFRSFVSMSQEAEVMQQWLDTVRPLRTGGRRRYLVPTDLPLPDEHRSGPSHERERP